MTVAGVLGGPARERAVARWCRWYPAELMPHRPTTRVGAITGQRGPGSARSTAGGLRGGVPRLAEPSPDLLVEVLGPVQFQVVGDVASSRLDDLLPSRRRVPLVEVEGEDERRPPAEVLAGRPGPRHPAPAAEGDLALRHGLVDRPDGRQLAAQRVEQRRRVRVLVEVAAEGGVIGQGRRPGQTPKRAR